MATFTGQLISATYDAILKTIDNDHIGSTAKQITDGLGNVTPLYISTTQIGIGITPTEAFHVSGNVLITGNITVNTDATITGNLSWGSLTDSGESITISKFVDASDGIANNNNDTSIPTSAAIKSYVDGSVTAQDLDFAGNTGTGSVDLDSNIFNVVGTTNEIITSATGQTLQIQLNSSGVILPNGSTATTQSQGDNSTKVATTAYVDSAIGGQDTLAEILANGNQTGGTDIIVDTGDNLALRDASKLRFGNGDDLEIYHNGSHSYIDNGATDLYLRTTGNGIFFKNIAGGGNEHYAKFISNGAVELYYDAVKKFETTSAGVSVTGRISNLTDPSAAQDAATKAYVDSQVGANNELSEVLANGNTTGGTDIAVSLGDNITFADSSKSIYGAGSDLQIYSDGTVGYIKGDDARLVNASGENIFRVNGDVAELYYNDSKKLETTSSGIAVTGNADVSSTVLVGGADSIFAENNIRFKSAGTAYIDHNTVGQSFIFRTSNSSSLDTTALTINSSGNATFSGNIQTTQITATNGLNYLKRNTDASLQLRSENTRSGLFITKPATDTVMGSALVLADESYRLGTANYYHIVMLQNGNTYFNQNVGINTTSPDSKLDVTGGDITVNTTGTGFMNFKYSGSQMGTIGTDGVDLKITANADLQLLPTGNVGIGTSSPSNKLFVTANTAGDYAAFIENTNSTNGYGLVARTASTGTSSYAFAARAASSDIFVVRADGNVGIGTTSPSALLEISGIRENQIRLTSYDTTAAVDETIGGIEFYSSDTGNEGVKASISAIAANTEGSAYMTFSTGTNTERMRIDSSGNVGIGIAPVSGARLTLGTGSVANEILSFASSTGGNAEFRNTSSTGTFTFTNANGSSEKMRIDSSGNVGIGTSSPDCKLDIRKGGTTTAQGDTDLLIGDSGAASSTAQVQILGGASGYSNLYFSDTSAYNVGGFIYNHSSNYLATNVNGAERMRIASNGRVGIGTTSPVALLHLKQANGANIRFENSTTSRVFTIGEGVGTNDVFSFRGNSFRSTDTLSVDFMNDRVGVGTISPTAKLDVKGDGADIFLQSNDYKIARIQPRGTGADYDRGLFSLFNASTEAVRIDSSGNSWLNGGNVGIGTTSPSTQLDVRLSSTTGKVAEFHNSVGYGIGFTVESDGGVNTINSESNQALAFATNGASNERMRITSSGDVQARRPRSNTAGDVALSLQPTDSSIHYGFRIDSSTNSFNLDRVDSAGNLMTINSSGNVGIGGTGIYTTVATLNLDGEGIAIKNDRNGSSNNWSYIRNTGILSGANIEFVTGVGTALTLNHDKSAKFSSYASFESTGTAYVRFKHSTGGLNYIGSSESLTGGFGDENDMLNYSASGKWGVYTNSAFAMVVDESQNVGIGTTSPENKLHILRSSSDTQSQIMVQNGGSGDAAIKFNVSGQSYVVGIDQDDSSKFKIASSSALGTNDRVTLLSSGNVGIGTITPNAKLSIYKTGFGGDTAGSNGTLDFGVGSTKYWQFRLASTSSGDLAIDKTYANVWTTPVTIQRSSGNVGIGTSSPDTKLNIEGVKNTSIITLGSTTNDSSWTAGDKIGGINFYSADGSGSGAGIKGSISYIATSGTGGSTAMTFNVAGSGTNDVERMRINNSGNVSIGSTTGYSPNLGGAVRLKSTFNANENSNLVIENANNGTSAASALVLGSYGADFTIRHTSAAAGGDLIFTRGTNERMRIKANGDIKIEEALGINVDPDNSSSGAALKTQAVGNGHRAAYFLGNSYTDVVQIDFTSFATGLKIKNTLNANSSNNILFQNTNGTVGSITTSGSATAYNTSSDYRLKENVVEMTGALDRVSQLKPSRFNFIADADKTVDGFLAHEVAEVVPEAITGEKDEVDEEGNAIYQGIDQAKLVPLLVGAIQELKAEVEQLKTQINK